MRTDNFKTARRRAPYAVGIFLVLVLYAVIVWLCVNGTLALLGVAQLTGQPDVVSAALQRSPAELQSLGRQFLQEQGYLYSGWRLLLFHTGLWLIPVLTLCLCAGIGAFALWQRRAARQRRQEREAALILWLDGGSFVPPASCTENVREAISAHSARQDDALQAARKRTEDSDRFAQNIYHQIKTPLAVGALLLEQIAATAAGRMPDVVKKAERCRKELNKISSLTQELLQAGRFDSGAVELHWQPEDLELLAEDIIGELQPLWKEKQVSVRLASPAVSDVQPVLCDAFWLGEALGNILKNCIEQTPAGSTIRCRIEHTPAQSRILIFDPGSFLPEDTDVFARYATTRAGGVGIGLHLAKQIAAAHFGTLTAGNRTDGCEFCLTLPVLQGAAPYRPRGTRTVTEL